jgi:hypothetical protein
VALPFVSRLLAQTGCEEAIEADSEFIARPGELYVPVAYAWRSLTTGEGGKLFGDELGSSPPHRHDRKTLFLGFTAAEPEFFVSVGWPLHMPMLDLRVEHINLTNISDRRPKSGEPDGERRRPPRSLINILYTNGIRDGDAENKKAMVKRILQGYPYSPAERQRILDYCYSDVLLLEKLVELLLPRITSLKQALMRGEYVKLTAEIFGRGQPADPWAAGWLRQAEARQNLRLRAVTQDSLTHGLYTGSTLTQAKMEEFLTRHGELKRWRRTTTGKLGTANRDFVALAERRKGEKEFEALPHVDKFLNQVRELKLIAGADNRYRTPIWAFSTITCRMAPDGSAYPFTTSAVWRPTIMPAAGSALAYLDFSSMEFGVAAGLSRCATMLDDYDGEPYLVLPSLAGLVPQGATKQTHGAERDLYKPNILAIQYGGGAKLMAYKLRITTGQGQRLVDLHHDRYECYWEWSDGRLQRAFDEGELITRDGWRCGVSSRTSIFTARNWLIQATAASIFRYACLMMRELGIRICAVVHDAVLIEAPTTRIDEEATRSAHCLERASRRFLNGLTLRVDAKIIREGERFEDKRATAAWEFIEHTLHEMDEGAGNAA